MRPRSSVLRACVVLVFVLIASQTASPQYPGVMPGPGWQVIRAQWGSGNRQVDVTARVRVLLSGNGMVQVNNQNMGSDPAVGADKTLVIEARNYQGQTRRFTFREGSAVDASQFYNYGGGVGANPGGGWQVMFADWGSGNRRQVVTDRVRAMLSGNGMVKVSNQNIGVDPAPGANKTLRVSARDAAGQVRQFTYAEGSNIDASQFYNYGGRPPGPPMGIPPGPPPNPGYGGGNLQIVRAYYGLNNRTNDVSQLLRSQVRNNTLVIQVNNQNMGGDPAPGGDKVLTVIYRVNGREQSTTVKEGNTLRIP